MGGLAGSVLLSLEMLLSQETPSFRFLDILDMGW